MKKNDISIVILSCDKFKVTWKPCIDYFFNTWTDCPYPVYLLNNFIESEDNRVTDLMVGEDFNWSDTLKKGLLKIDQDRVFFIFDDSFITKIALEEVEIIFKMAIENDLESVTLRKNPFGKGLKYNNRLYKIKPTAKYRNSLFLNLFKKEVLLGLLKDGENAWEFEKEGNERSENIDFYSVYSTKLASYHHGIVKGKWLPKTKNHLLKKGYLLKGNNFKSFNNLEVLFMNFHAFLFFSLNKLLHFIKSL